MEDKISITNLTKMKKRELVPTALGQVFLTLKNEILGKKYSLSIAFVEKAKMKELNKKYRGKNSPTNILSFPLSKNEGEILLCPAVIKTETKKFNRNFRELLGFLVIHGCLHLKGMAHGSTMEKQESKYDQKYFGRH
jgi:probable rRNA maturation factor